MHVHVDRPAAAPADRHCVSVDRAVASDTPPPPPPRRRRHADLAHVMSMLEMATSSLRLWYCRLLSLVFFSIGSIMLFNPAINMSQDGIHFSDMGVGGRAEVRAYYFGVGDVRPACGHIVPRYAAL